MEDNQIYLIKSGVDSFIEVTGTKLFSKSGNFGFHNSNPSMDVEISGDLNVIGDMYRSGVLVDKNSQSFTTSILSGAKNYEISFPAEFDEVPAIGVTLEIEDSSPIIPYVVSGVSTRSYYINFASTVPSDTYRINTIFGGAGSFSGYHLDALSVLPPDFGGKWDTTGENIYFTGGNVGIGTSDPSVELDVDGSVNVSNSLTIGGDLNVNGNTTTVNSTTITVDDKNLELAASTPPTDVGADGGGIILKGSTDKSILWDSTNNKWNFNLGLTTSSNIGIGTTNPGGDLEILGATSDANFLIGGAPEDPSSPEPWRIQAEGDFFHIGQNKSSFAKYLTFNGSSVGIGTTNPGDNKLRIYDSDAGTAGTDNSPQWSDSLFLMRNIPSNYQGTRILFAHGKAAIGGFRQDHSEDGSHHLSFFTGSNIQAGMSERMRIKHDGKIGIGIKNPKGKLHIFDDTAGNDDLLALVLSNYDYGLGETGQSVSIEGRVRNNGGGDSPVSKIVFGKDSDFSEVDKRDGNISFHTMFGNNGTAAFQERMRISSAGNVAIGTTNPHYKLHVASGTNGAFLGINYASSSFGNTLSQETAMTYGGGKLHIGSVNTAGNPQITASFLQDGKVGIGTTNPIGTLHVHGSQTAQTPTAKFYNGWGSSVATVHIVEEETSTGHVGLFVGKDDFSSAVLMTKYKKVGIGTTNPSETLEVRTIAPDGTSAAERTAKYDGISILTQKDGFTPYNGFGGGIVFNNETYTNGEIYSSAGIYGGIGDNSTNTNVGGHLAFHTSNTKTDDPTEKMRITANGNVGIGTGSPGSYKLYVNGSAFAVGGWTGSDDRLKHNEQPIVGALETLSKITPKKYIKTSEMYDADHDFELDDDGNPIDEDGESVDHFIEAGIIAQELLNVPELKFAVSDETVDDDGNIAGPYGVNYNSLLIYAIKAIQELSQKVEELENK